MKAVAKRLLYASGALTSWHRVRNRRALTVVMFHRVLGVGDRRYSYCDPEYTIRADLFAQCLAFFQANYHIVDLEQVQAAGTHLPDYPLLITFDDGWADHEQVALPILANAQLPAVAFIAGDAVDAPEPDAFWEIQLLHGFQRGALGSADLAALWAAAGAGTPPAATGLDEVRALIARLFALPPAQIPPLLAPYRQRLETPDDRHMISTDELRNLARHRIAIGGHGRRHMPLARIDDPEADLYASAQILTQRTGEAITSMSFPHGSYNQRTATAALARFRTVFTSDPILNPVDTTVPRLLGRIGFDPASITDGSGRFQPDLLALCLMRREQRLLDGTGPARRAA